MQSVSSRIWTRVAVSISYDDNDYTTGTTVFSKVISPIETQMASSRIWTRLAVSISYDDNCYNYLYGLFFFKMINCYDYPYCLVFHETFNLTNLNAKAATRAMLIQFVVDPLNTRLWRVWILIDPQLRWESLIQWKLLSPLHSLQWKSMRNIDRYENEPN